MLKKFIKDESGGSVIIQLGVILIVMIMLFYGFTMFTNGVAVKLALRTAAREGAREYATSNDPNKAIKRTETELELSNIRNAEIKTFTDGDGRGVVAIKNYPFYVPFAGTYDIKLKGVGIFVEEPIPKPR